jgi:hypothetical protein
MKELSILAEVEYTNKLLVPTIYQTPIWRYAVQCAGPILPFMEDAFNREPVKCNNIIIDQVEYDKVFSLSDLKEKSYYYAGDTVYIRYPHDNPAWLYYSHRYGLLFGYTSTSPALLNDRTYMPGLLSVPVIEQSADTYTYDEMKFTGASITIDNSRADFDAVENLLGNEFNILCGFKGAAYADYRKLAQYYIANISFSLDKAVFSLKDKRERLGYKIPNELYTAEKYPFIEDNMIDKDMQEAYGRCFGVPGVCLNGKQIYSNQLYPEEEQEEEYLDFYEFRFSSRITRVDKIEVKMTNGELPDPENPDNTVKIDGWTTVYQRTPGQPPDDWSGWKNGVVPGEVESLEMLEKGVVALHYAAAKQSGRRENKTNDVRMDGLFINLNTPLDIIKDIMTVYGGVSYDDHRYNTAEFERELGRIPHEIGILFDKSLSIYEAVEKIQSGVVAGFQFCVWQNLFTVRLDDPNRAEKPDIKRQDIMNLHEIEVDWNAGLYGSYTDIEYAYNYSEKKGKHWIDKKYRIDILDIHRIEKDWSVSTLLASEADAKLKSDIILEDFRELHPIIRGIKLFGGRWFDYRVYDVVYIDLSLPGETIEKYPLNIIRLMEYTAEGNQVRMVHGRDDEHIILHDDAVEHRGKRDFVGRVRCQILVVSIDLQTGVVTMDVRIRNRSEIWE